jgi:hypothetical protein
VQAATNYKLAQEYDLAASSFLTASTLLQKADNNAEYTKCLNDAAACYAKINYESRITYLFDLFLTWMK